MPTDMILRHLERAQALTGMAALPPARAKRQSLA